MRAASFALLFLVACGSPPVDPGHGGQGSGILVTSLSEASSDAGSGSNSSSSGFASTDSSSSTSTGAQTTAPDGASSDADAPDETSGSGPFLGCGGKLDFVFVLSRSDHQEKHQNEYLPALPLFINTIVSEFSDYDVHVLVTDTDIAWGDEMCSGCAALPGGCAEIPDYPCGFEPEMCDLKLGMGQTATAGFGASNKVCAFASGERWIELPGEPDPEKAFLCAAQVGWSYLGFGQPVGAALAAASYTQCNLGFRRSDALLVITIISGPEDEGTPGGPYQWRKQLLQWVNGNEKGVVLLVLRDDTDEPNPICNFGAGPPRMKQLAESLPYGRWASICAPAAPFFLESVALVKEACDLYIPQ